MFMWRFLVFLALLRTAAARVLYSRDRHSLRDGANATVQEHMDTILDARPANASASVELIARMPLKQFAFQYDSIAGRVQLGLLGPDLKALLPDGVQVLPQRVVFDPTTQRKVALQNFHVVDKDALFMHNVAATQVLLAARLQVAADLTQVQALLADHQLELRQLQAYLAQEASAQLQEKRRAAEAQADEARHRIEEARVRGEEERQTLAVRKEHEVQIEQLKHELAHQRLQEDDGLRKQQNRDLVALQEESHGRLELQRRETEEVLKGKQLALERERMALERTTALEKAQIDVAGRIQQQRTNQDIEMAQLQRRLEADRVKLMQALQATFDNLGRGVLVLLSDRDKCLRLVGGLVALAAGVYSSREVIRIVGKLIEQRLGKPSLIRETSRSSGVLGWLRARIWTKAHGQDELKDVVLRNALGTRVREIAKSVRNAILHGAPYRHLLLYGPPGTGKTMVAKRLARSSGMEYAILSGGDVGPLGSDAVTELHALFHWAEASPRGVLIFIDEAEAFLGCRATRKTHMSEAMRNALNALLYHTGSQSKHFMLVIATNRPEDLDTAVTDRIDDTLHFDLPQESERVRLLEMYFSQYLGSMESAEMVKMNQSDGKKGTIMQEYGTLTEGLSGREIAKMMLYMQSIVYAQDDVKVTRELIDRVVKDKVEEHHRKIALRGYNER